MKQLMHRTRTKHPIAYGLSRRKKKAGKIFFLERSGQLPACINKEKAFYMKNLLRKVLNRMIGAEQMTFRIG